MTLILHNKDHLVTIAHTMGVLQLANIDHTVEVHPGKEAVEDTQDTVCNLSLKGTGGGGVTSYMIC